MQEIKETRTVIHQMLKDKGSNREWKDALRSEKDETVTTLTNKIEERDTA